MPIAIGLLSALLVMLVVYEMTPVASSVRGAQFDRIRGAAHGDDRALPFWRVLLAPLNSLVAQFTPQAWRETVRRQLYWANLEGSWLGWNEVEFWGLSLALAAAFAVVLLPNGPLVLVTGALLGFFGPALLLRATARKIERALTRELPDTLYLLAAIVSVGLSLDEALRRFAEYASTDHRTILARWLARVLAKAHGQEVAAVLRAEAVETGQPRLIAMTTKMELIQTKGAAGSANLFRALADDQAREYRTESERRAKEIGGSLIFPILGFFFAPYFVVIAAPLFASMAALFVGG